MSEVYDWVIHDQNHQKLTGLEVEALKRQGQIMGFSEYLGDSGDADTVRIVINRSTLSFIFVGRFEHCLTANPLQNPY